MKLSLHIVFILLFVVSSSFSVFGQENDNDAKEVVTPPKTKEDIRKYSVVEFADYDRLSPAQIKHFEQYRQKYELQKARKYSPSKCFEPIYSPMAEFAKKLRPLAMNAANKAQQAYEKLFNEKKEQLAKRMKLQYNAYLYLAQQCEKVETAFKDKKLGEIDEAVIMLQRQLIMMKKEGLKVPNREWLVQKEADVILQKIFDQMKAKHGVQQVNMRQQSSGVRTQPKMRQ